MVHELARRRHAAGEHEDEAAERVDIFAHFVIGQVHVEGLFKIVDGEAGVGFPEALADFLDERGCHLVMFRLDFARDLSP